MANLGTLLDDLKRQPRHLTNDEDIYLSDLAQELRRAPSDTARWRILEREGINKVDWSDAEQDVLDKMTALYRVALN
ncbi:MAG: hypothetical protein KA223_00875 [Candidatus Accumulibacter sp.]|jgi:hypothetical protein|nr:hypothetical protein [Accumulibacter sp.]